MKKKKWVQGGKESWKREKILEREGKRNWSREKPPGKGRKSRGKGKETLGEGKNTKKNGKKLLAVAVARPVCWDQLENLGKAPEPSES